MILAGAALLGYAGEPAARRRPRDPRGVPRGGRARCATADLGGDAGTSEFTDEVIRRTQQKLEVWSSL